MYTAFYGLFEKPFSLSPDPRYLFFANGHREALAHLRYGIEQGEGFIAVTGEVGTGKSTLCRALIEGFDSEIELAYLFNPPSDATELLQAIALEFGLVPAGHQRHSLNDQLNRFLVDRKRQGRRVLLIIDEAQNLDVAVLEEIRLLSNLETATSKLIQIILLGQPELDRKLDSRELRQLRQRISVRWFLGPLSRDETADYVAHRLQVAAGGKRDIFTKGAMREIYRRTGGIPRRINLLADRCLLAGFGANEHQVGRKVVRRAAAEIEGSNVRRESGAGWLSLRVGTAAALFVLAGLLGNWVAESQMLRDLRILDRSEPAPETLAAVAASGEHAEPVARSASVAQFELLDSILASGDVSMPATNEDADEITIESLKGIKTVSAGPVGSRGERLRNTILPGNYLGRLLDNQDPNRALEAAIVSIFDSFGTPSHDDAEWDVPQSDDETVALLESRGLHVLRVLDSSLSELREFNHPAILFLRTEYGDAREVALRQLDDERATLFGVTDDGALDVSIAEVENQWDGDALIVWSAFEEIPTILTRGNRGDGVVWLQRALGELGVYAGAATGTFDASTERSVRMLQADASLDPDGAVGPRTQMVLYGKLQRYNVPRLEPKEGSG